MAMIEMAVGQLRLTQDQARLAVAGYAFGSCTIHPKKAFDGAFQADRVPRWGYQTFDCVPASAGEEFNVADVLVASGLNGRLDVRAIAVLHSAANRAAGPLATAERLQPSFADMSSAELSDHPPDSSAGEALSRAWQQMMATRRVGTALTHKVLHHKRPALFPLLDRHTATALHERPNERNSWQQINAELNDNRTEFEALRSWFEGHAKQRGTAALSLPRLHDILLWLYAMEQLADAMNAGEGELGDDQPNQV